MNTKSTIKSKIKNVNKSLIVYPILITILLKDFNFLASLNALNNLKALKNVSDGFSVIT